MSRSKVASVLVVAAHPDDEVLGCGGTIACHAQAGDFVHVLILAEGITSRDRQRKPATRQLKIRALGEAARRANKILGANSLTLHRFPDNRMDGTDLLDIIKVVEWAVHKYRPETLYTHHGGDLNIDHRRVHEAVVTAGRPYKDSRLKNLLFFEVPSSTECQIVNSAITFNPNWFIDISGTLPTKLQALRAYQSEMRPWPHPRSLKAVEHLVRWRGSSVGMQAAEAFMLGRKLQRREL